YEALAHWFRNDPLYLELDVAAPDARLRLERFLGRPVPWWGQSNINPEDRAAQDGSAEQDSAR
ncbi:MAG: sulfotransferase family protein, partial [Tritonibacter mobilis]|nr:sulfotransferase family protein [Tritonibacter mobilis]